MRSRLLPLSAFALLCGPSATSAQPAAAPSPAIAQPAPNDEEGWVAFCAGLYVELVRQASAENDQTQFSESTRRIGNLTTELLYQTTMGHWRVSPRQGLAWGQDGRRTAGAEIWDLPLAPGETPTWHDAARLARREPERMCDDRSDKAAIFTRGLFAPR
jgi:hypothetical protein